MALASAPFERRLLRQNITYSMAKKEETNILHELGYWPQQNAFFDYIHEHRSLLAEIVAHHLGIHSSVCQVADMSDWLHGSFNLCVPVFIRNSSRVLVRFPLPYRVGDNFRPGNSDEKVRCEAGTYAWLQEECPTVRTPRLYGFALSTGKVVCVNVQQTRNSFLTSYSSPLSTVSLFMPAYCNIFDAGFYPSSELQYHLDLCHIKVIQSKPLDHTCS